jgi:hypothetical protein
LDFDPQERGRLDQWLIRQGIATGCEKSVTPTAAKLQGSLKTDTLRSISARQIPQYLPDFSVIFERNL